MAAGKIRIGVGGWVYEPWRGAFYPATVKQKDELAYMSRHVTAIEINSTYYGSQKPATFKKWADETPEGFVFSVKGNRFCTNRRELSGAGDSLKKFFDQGISELGDKLGPVLWQFAPTKKFDEADFTGFLELLPEKLDGPGACATASRRATTVSAIRHSSRCSGASARLRCSPTTGPTGHPGSRR